MGHVRTPTASRRTVLGAGALVAAAPAAGRAATASQVAEAKRIAERYQSFGDKASGGPGDTASGEWLEGELRAMGYALARQAIEVPAYEGEATLTCGPAKAAVIAQATVVPTAATGVSGPLYLAGAGKGPGSRWSSCPTPLVDRVGPGRAAGEGGRAAGPRPSWW
jgi:hypothetical protein